MLKPNIAVDDGECNMYESTRSTTYNKKRAVGVCAGGSVQERQHDGGYDKGNTFCPSEYLADAAPLLVN